MTRSHWLLGSLSALFGLVVGRIVPISNPTSIEARPTQGVLAESARSGDAVELVRPAASGGVAMTAVASPDQLEADFRRLWDAAVKAGDKSIDLEVQAIMKLAAVDPYRAVSLAMKREGPESATLLLRLITSMKSTGHVALRALLENPKWKGEWAVVNVVFENLAKIDPRMAWEEATKDGRTFVGQASSVIAQAWADQSPREAVAFAMTLGDRTQRKNFADAVFTRWMNAKLDDFAAWLRALPERGEWDAVIPWSNATAATPAQFLELSALSPERLPNPRFEGESAFDGIFKKPEKKDDYLAWIGALPEGVKRDAAITSLAKAMLDWNPEDSLPLLASLKDVNAQTQITSAVAAYRTTSSPVDGVAFADSLQGQARSLALRSVVSTWAEFDPAGAAAFIASRPNEVSGEMDGVMRQWSKHEPQAAASFALAQKEAGVAAGVANQVNYGLRTAMSTWVNKDAYAASAWVTNMPPGRTRDIATDALAGAAMSVEPEGALGWAMSIGDSELRAHCIRDCITSWSWRDATSAQAWLNGAVIDDDLRATLTAKVKEREGNAYPLSSMSDGKRTVFY